MIRCEVCPVGILAATSQRLEGARQALRSPCRDGSDGERERERESGGSRRNGEELT